MSIPPAVEDTAEQPTQCSLPAPVGGGVQAPMRGNGPSASGGQNGVKEEALPQMVGTPPSLMPHGAFPFGAMSGPCMTLMQQGPAGPVMFAMMPQQSLPVGSRVLVEPYASTCVCHVLEDRGNGWLMLWSESTKNMLPQPVHVSTLRVLSTPSTPFSMQPGLASPAVVMTPNGPMLCQPMPLQQISQEQHDSANSLLQMQLAAGQQRSSGTTKRKAEAGDRSKARPRQRREGEGAKEGRGLRRGRVRLFAPSPQLSSENRAILTALDEFLRDSGLSLCAFCRESKLDRHNVNNLFTGWKHSIDEASAARMKSYLVAHSRWPQSGEAPK